MKRLPSILVGLALAAPFYLLLIDTVSTPELIAGSVAVLIAAVVFALAYAEGAGHAAYRARWVAGTWHVVADVPRQVWVVCAEIVRQVRSPRPSRGRLRTTPFVTGSDHDAHLRGRRALAEALGSLAPNTIVVGVDPESETLLVHQLRYGGGAEQLDPLALADAGSE